MEDTKRIITVDIPGVGIAKVSHLGYFFEDSSFHGKVDNSLEYDMAVTEVNGIKCLICYPDNSIELCRVFLEGTFIEYYQHLRHGDMYFWSVHSYEFGESSVEEVDYLNDCFNCLLKRNLILECESDTEGTLYVLPNYDTFDLKNYPDAEKEIACIIKKYLEDYFEDNREDFIGEDAEGILEEYNKAIESVNSIIEN